MAARAALCPRHHVFKNGEMVEEPNALQGPSHAGFGQLGGLQGAAADVWEANGPRRRLLESTHDVERGRLAGAVWANEAHYLILVHAKRNVVECQQSAEANGDIGEFQCDPASIRVRHTGFKLAPCRGCESLGNLKGSLHFWGWVTGLIGLAAHEMGGSSREDGRKKVGLIALDERDLLRPTLPRQGGSTFAESS